MLIAIQAYQTDRYDKFVVPRLIKTRQKGLNLNNQGKFICYL